MDIKHEGNVLSINITDDELCKFGDSLLEQVGKMVRDYYQRRRRQLLCERDGHPESETLTHFGMCDRCKLVVDQEKWDRVIKSEGMVSHA